MYTGEHKEKCCDNHTQKGENNKTCYANHISVGKYNKEGDNGHILTDKHTLMLTKTIDDDHPFGFHLVRSSPTGNSL